MPVIGYFTACSAADSSATHCGRIPPGLERSSATSRARTSRSNIAGRTVNSIGCRRLAADLVGRRVACIVAGGSASALAAKAATTTIPIVFTSAADPVGSACREPRPAGRQRHRRHISEPRVGGEAAGAAARAGARRRSVAVLVNPNQPGDCRDSSQRRASGGAAASGCRSIVVSASTEHEIERPSRRSSNSGPTRCSSVRDPSFISRREQIVALAARHALPAIISVARVRRSRRADELWHQHAGHVSPGRRLRRPHPQGREAGRPAGRCSRPSSSWSSTSRPPRRSASTCRRPLLARADEVIE